MPAPYHKPRAYYRKGDIYTLGEAAALGQLVVVSCKLCYRAATYLAIDLVELFGPDRDASLSPFACSTCRRLEYVRVSLRLPEAGDWGSLPVRRPGPVKRIQTWRWVKLGDRAK